MRKSRVAIIMTDEILLGQPLAPIFFAAKNGQIGTCESAFRSALRCSGVKRMRSPRPAMPFWPAWILIAAAAACAYPAFTTAPPAEQQQHAAAPAP